MLLTHRGKIIADLNIYVLEEAITVDTAPETAENLFSELDKYIIADDIELSDATTETGAIAVHGPQIVGARSICAKHERSCCFTRTPQLRS